MAYSERLADRVRAAFAAQSGVSEKKMFGGLAFLLNGNMCCGIVGDELMVRVGPAAYKQALAEPHVREMDFTGRAMKGMIYVAVDGLLSDQQIAAWVEKGRKFAKMLPAK